MTVYTSRLSPASNTTSSSGTNTTYATVRAYVGATTTSGTSASTGQLFQSPNYSVGQYFLTFNTSAIPASQREAVLSLVMGGSNSAGDEFEVREVPSSANGIAGASLGSTGTFLGSIPSGTSGRNNIVLDITTMTRGAAVVLCVYSKNQRLGTAPTGTTQPAVVSITGAAANRPYLDFPGPWQFVGISSVVETGGTTLTLTEPSGVRDGDLLVACISSRSSATTAPSATGWTAVGSQSNNSTLTGSTSAVASGSMFYKVRSGTPALGFTIPAGNTVSQGQIAAYRGVNYGSPLDASTAVTTAINTTSVSVTGVTTTQDDDLIVAMCAGGQEASWLGFNNLTAGLGASTDTSTTVKTSASWTERSDTATTTGADTSLAVFDAVRPTTGATGNLAVTASLGGSNVVIAGAFKLLRTNATELNPLDKKVDVTLSNANLTMSSAGTANNWVRSTKPMAGRRYVEVTTTTVANTVIGIADLSAMTYPGSNAKSFGMFANAGGSINGTFPTWGPTYASGNIVSMAVDLNAKRVWFRVNGGAWNAGGSADPYTGVGGYDISAYTGTVHYLIVSGDNGVANTVNFGASAFAYTPPTGFQAWGETYGLSAPFPGPNTTLSAPSGGVITVTGAGSTDIWRTIWQMHNLIPGHTYKMEQTCSGGGFFQSSSVPYGSEGEFGFVALSTASNPAYNTYTFIAPAASDTYCSVYQNVVSPRTTLEYPIVTDLSIPTASTPVTVTVSAMAALTASVGNETVNLGMAVNVSMLANGMTVLGASPGAPAYSNSNTTTYATRTNVSLNLPGSAAANFQVAIVVVSATGSPPAVTPPAGWTSLFTATEISDGSTNRRLYGWYRQWQEGDASPVTFTHGNCTSIASIHAYSNVDGASPVDVQSSNSGTGITSTATSLTTVRHATERLLFIGEDWNTGAGGRNPPSGHSERFDAITYLADVATTALGVTGDVTMTNTNASGSEPWQAKLVALVPGGVSVTTGGVNVSVTVTTMAALTITCGDETASLPATATITAVPAMTMTLGNESVNLGTSTTIAGVPALTITLGDENAEADANVDVTSPGLTITQGDAVAGVPTPVNVTGGQLSVTAGDASVSIKTDVFASGNFMVITAGNASFGAGADATPLAMNALAITCGDESVTGKANVSPTGIPLTVTLGEETVEGDANATITGMAGLAITAGNVAAGATMNVNVTGLQMAVSTAAPGAITVNYGIRVIVEGFQLTCSIGSSVYVPQASGPIQREGMMKTMANMMGN